MRSAYYMKDRESRPKPLQHTSQLVVKVYCLAGWVEHHDGVVHEQVFVEVKRNIRTSIAIAAERAPCREYMYTHNIYISHTRGARSSLRIVWGVLV